MHNLASQQGNADRFAEIPHVTDVRHASCERKLMHEPLASCRQVCNLARDPDTSFVERKAAHTSHNSKVSQFAIFCLARINVHASLTSSTSTRKTRANIRSSLPLLRCLIARAIEDSCRHQALWDVCSNEIRFVQNGPEKYPTRHVGNLNVPWALVHRDKLASSVTCRRASNIESVQPREGLRIHGAQSSPSSKTSASKFFSLLSPSIRSIDRFLLSKSCVFTKSLNHVRSHSRGKHLQYGGKHLQHGKAWSRRSLDLSLFARFAANRRCIAASTPLSFDADPGCIGDEKLREADRRLFNLHMLQITVGGRAARGGPPAGWPGPATAGLLEGEPESRPTVKLPAGPPQNKYSVGANLILRLFWPLR